MLAWFASSGRASIALSTYINVTAIYQQTGAVAPASPIGYTFGVVAAGPLNAPVNWSYPGSGSPQALQGHPNGRYTFDSPIYSSLSSLQAAYPFGDYIFTAVSNGVTQGQSTDHYAANYFPLSFPALTAASYNSLQGLVPNSSVTVNDSGPVWNPGVPYAYYPTFTVTDTSGQVWFSGIGDTGVSIPAGTLPANALLNFQITFTNYQWGGAFIPSDPFYEEAFSNAEEGSFYTVAPAPEPVEWAPVALGLIALAWRRRATASNTIQA